VIAAIHAGPGAAKVGSAPARQHGPTLSEGVSEFFGKIAKNGGKTQEEVEAEFIKTHRPTSLIQRLLSVEEVLIL